MDELQALKRLAGISEFNGYSPYQVPNDAKQKQIIEKEQNIKPGDKEWFDLWFSNKQQLNMPVGFRGRK